MQMIMIIAKTYIGDAKLPAITHRFLAASYKEARNLFRLHRKHDAMLRATTGAKDAYEEKREESKAAREERERRGFIQTKNGIGSFEGIPMRTVFVVQKVDSELRSEGAT
jgi:hypothetical protein